MSESSSQICQAGVNMVPNRHGSGARYGYDSQVVTAEAGVFFARDGSMAA